MQASVMVETVRTEVPDGPISILSWNLLHGRGAGVEDVAALIRRWHPDLMLMQEATRPFEELTRLVGGDYAREPLPGRRHGLACWSRLPFHVTPEPFTLPPGAFVRRICQIIRMQSFAVANVHLSHGQMLNRRQLRMIADEMPAEAAVLGDFNLVGPALLRGFRDVGPRHPTHRMADLLPLRIDRCLARGLLCEEAIRLPRVRSDHHPILVRLAPTTRRRPN